MALYSVPLAFGSKKAILKDCFSLYFGLDFLWKVAPAVNNSANFHDVVDHHIKNGVVSDIDAVVWVLALFCRMVLFKSSSNS